MAHSTLENYYQTIFSLVQHYHYGIKDLEDIYPFERDIFVELLQAHLRKMKEVERQI